MNIFGFRCLVNSVSWSVFATVLWGDLFIAAAQIPAIEMNALVPAGGQIGQMIDVSVIAGANLDEIAHLRFSHPGIVAEVKTQPARLLESLPQPTFGQFQVTIDPEVPPGVYEVRALGRYGLSSPRSFLVTKSPAVIFKDDHSSRQTAAVLPPVSVVYGQCQPQQSNFYRLALSQGQRAQVVAQAQQLDSAAIPVLILLDPEGREIQRSRPVGQFPAVIDWIAQQDGDYHLQMYDFLHRGGDEYHYAMQAEVSALTGAAVDLVVKDIDLDASGKQLECELQVLLKTMGQVKSFGRLATQGPVVGQRPSSLDPAAIEADWVDPMAFGTPDSALQTLPFRIASEFDDQSRVANHDFQATAGQAFSVQVASASLGSLTDPRIVLYKVNRDPEGVESLQQVAEQDDAGTIGGPDVRLQRLDPNLNFTAAEAGVYRIKILDNTSGQRSQNRLAYVLRVEPSSPNFRLLAYRPYPNNAPAAWRPAAANLALGGTESIRVLVLRTDGFDGPIDLRVEGLPEGVTCPWVVVPRGINEAMLTVACSENAKSWQGDVTIVGQSMDQPGMERLAHSATMVRPASPQRNSIESRLTANLSLAVNEAEVAPIFVQLGDENVLEMCRGGKLPFAIKVTRRPGGDGRCVLRPQNLPPKVTLGEVAVEADKSEASAELQLAVDAAPGEYSFWMQNETKVKWTPNPQALQRQQDYLASLQTGLADLPASGLALSPEDMASKKTEWESAIAAATASVQQLQKVTTLREVNAFLPTTGLRFRIVDRPFQIQPPQIVVGAVESKLDVELKVQRQFGFADAIEFSLVDNPPIAGLQAAAVEFPAAVDSVSLQLTVPATAISGTYQVPLKWSCNFNGQPLVGTWNLSLQVAAAQQE